jgi:WD40 repeat protein
VPESFDKAALAWALPWDADWVTAVAFLGPTRRVAAGNNLGQILLWELPEKAGDPLPSPIRRLDGHTNAITRLVATADGKWLYSASYDHTIRAWDMTAPAKGDETVVLNARAIAEAEARKRNGAKVPAPIPAKVALQQAAKTFDHHKEWVTALTLSRDGSLLFGGDDGGQVLACDRDTGKEKVRWAVKGWVGAIAVSPDNTRALVAERLPLVFDPGRHVGLKLWDATTGKVLKDLQADYKDMYVAAAAYSPDGKLIAIGRGGEADGNNGKVWLLDGTDGKKQKELTPGHQYGVTDLAFHPDGKHLASAGRDTLVRLWGVPDGKLVKELGKPRGGQFKDWIHAVSFSADGKWLAAADMAGAVQVWAL